MTDSNDKTTLIRMQNDAFRLCTGLPPIDTPVKGQHVMTRGITDLSPDDVIAVLAKIRRFENFTEGNDLYAEHDFGSFDQNGKKVLWKIDYYDTDYRNGSEDPSDLAKTRRVLTIMLAEEY